MVGTCLDPPLWSDLREKEGRRTGWCERGDEEKLTACAIPPPPKETVFTQVMSDSNNMQQNKISLRLLKYRPKSTYLQQLPWHLLLWRGCLLLWWVAFLNSSPILPEENFLELAIILNLLPRWSTPQLSFPFYPWKAPMASGFLWSITLQVGPTSLFQRH